MKSINIEAIDAMIRVKKYEELSESQLELLHQNGLDEHAYADFREIVLGAQAVRQVDVSTNQKRQLVKAFKEVNRKNTFGLLERKVSISWQLLTVFMAFLIGYYLMPDKLVEKERLVELPPTIVVDTLLVQLPADTVYIEKFRIKEVPVYITKVEEKLAPEVIITGTTLANQHKLKELLIEGE